MVPWIRRNFKTGVSVSSRMVIPAGIMINSPAAGSGPPPQVKLDDQTSMYSKAPAPGLDYGR